MSCVIQYDAVGKVKWALRIRNSSSVPPRVAVSPRSEPYVLFMYVGGYEISAPGSVSPVVATPSGNGGAFVKLNASGDVVWVNNITMDVAGSGIALTGCDFDSFDNVLFAGTVNNAVTFNGQSGTATSVVGAVSTAQKTLVVVKYSPSGIFLQHHVQTFLHNLTARDISVDKSNRVLVVGHTRTASGTAGPTTMDNNILFPSVTTVNMSFVLVFSHGLSLIHLYALNSADVQVHCVCTDQNSNFYLSGVSRLGGGQVMTFPSPADQSNVSYQTGFPRDVFQFALDDHFVGKFSLSTENLVRVEWLNRISGASQGYTVQFLKYNIYSGLVCGVNMLKGYAHSRPADMSKASHTFTHPRKLLIAQDETRHDRFVLHYTSDGVLRDVLNIHSEEPDVYTGISYTPSGVVHGAVAFARTGNMFLASKFRSFLKLSRKNWNALLTTFQITGESEEETGYVMRIGNAEAGPEGTVLPSMVLQRFLIAPLMIELLRNTGNVYIPQGVQLRFKRQRFDAPTDIMAQQQIQQWIDDAVDVSTASLEQPFASVIPVEETVNVFTEGDFLYLYDQAIDLRGLSEDAENVFYARNGDFVHSIQVVFYGGSGGAEVTNMGKFMSGAMTFGADQITYDTAPEDGSVTIVAGMVTQGMGGQQRVSAPRIPNSNCTFDAHISLGVEWINEVFARVKFVQNTFDDSVSVPATASRADLAALAMSLFNTSRYGRNERESLALAFMATLSTQIANDLPDEFRSWREARARLGLTIEQVDTVLRTPLTTLGDDDEGLSAHPLRALIRNVVLTEWQEGAVYSAFGSDLLRNIVQSVLVLKPSRIVTDDPTGWQHLRFRPGDEIVVYITFTGTVRVSIRKPLERFGMTTTQIEHSDADLDSASWLKLNLRFVV